MRLNVYIFCIPAEYKLLGLSEGRAAAGGVPDKHLSNGKVNKMALFGDNTCTSLPLVALKSFIHRPCAAVDVGSLARCDGIRKKPVRRPGVKWDCNDVIGVILAERRGKEREFTSWSENAKNLQSA